MKIQILGPGCPKCTRLLELTEQAVADLGLECNIEKVADIQKIIARGVMMTPALVINGEIKAVGKIPSVEEIKRLLD